jgi:hypothetical protein
LFLGTGAVNAPATDWPHWRGLQRNGISTESGWLDVWSRGEPKIAWKANVGLGYSSVVVAQGRVFTLGHDDEKDTVWAFDAVTGKELWKHSYPAELGDKYFDGGTTGTPTVAGDRVFTLSRWGDVFCFEAATGKIVWSKNVQSETGAPIPDWGFAGAPLVHENLLVLNVGDAGLALDKNTGKIIWQSAKKAAGYSSPLPVQREGKWIGLLGNACEFENRSRRSAGNRDGDRAQAIGFVEHADYKRCASAGGESDHGIVRTDTQVSHHLRSRFGIIFGALLRSPKRFRSPSEMSLNQIARNAEGWMHFRCIENRNAATRARTKTTEPTTGSKGGRDCIDGGGNLWQGALDGLGNQVVLLVDDREHRFSRKRIKLF